MDNRSIRAGRLADVLRPAPNTAVAGRPVVNLSLAVNHAVGGLDPYGFRVANLLFHVGCALLVFAVARRTLTRLGHLRARAPDIAFAAALLWAVHPLNSEVVNYVSQRTESLMALCFLSTVYAATRAHERSYRAAWSAAAVVACALGMACKESMVTAPLVVALYDRTLVFRSWREALRERGGLYLGLAATWMPLAALVAEGPRAAVGGWGSGVPVWTYLLNQTVVITEYLRLVIWPTDLVSFYGWPVSLTLGDVWPEALLIVALLVATVAALHRNPPLGFVGAWFFVTLAPASSIIPIATEVGAERRMYVPLMGVLVGLVAVGAHGLAWAGARWPGSTVRLAGRGLLVTLVVALAVATVNRNREYASGLTLARTLVERRPTGVAHHILGEELLGAGRDEEALAELRTAVAKGNSRAGFLLGMELYNRGRYDESAAELTKFVATAGLPYRLVPRWLEPTTAEIIDARIALGRVYLLRREWSLAASESERVLQRAPGHPDARRLLADALFGQERLAEAAAQYRRYLELRPNDAAALMNLGVAEIGRDNLHEAIELFRRATRTDPQSAAARRLLAMALLDRGDYEEATVEARAAARLSDDPATRELLDRAEGGRRR